MSFSRRKITYVTDRLSLRGGADQHLLQILRCACEAEHDVTVAAGRIEGDVELPDQVDVVRIKGLAAAVARETKLQALDTLVSNADLVHLQNVMNPVALQRSVAHRPSIITVQDHRFFCPGPGKTLPNGQRCNEFMSEETCSSCLPDASYRARLLKLTRSRLDTLRGSQLLVLSRYMASELEGGGLAGAHVLPPWVDVPQEPSTPAGDRRGFLLGGRLVPHKGVTDALHAWRLADTGHPLTVAGAGPLESELQGVRQVGWLDARALRRELQEARALLFPSRWQEPFGILGVEALALGTPVVVASTGGTSEWSERGCLRVEAGDIPAMATAISKLARHSDLCTKLGEDGRALVSERFGRIHIEKTLWEIYEGATR